MNIKMTDKPIKKANSDVAAKSYDPAAQSRLENEFFIALIACLVIMISMQNALAQTAAIDSPMGIVLCNIASIVYGNLGRGIATLAVVVIGVGATLGKTSWGLAMTVAVGIAVIFNAGNIVFAITGGPGLGIAGC